MDRKLGAAAESLLPGAASMSKVGCCEQATPVLTACASECISCIADQYEQLAAHTITSNTLLHRLLLVPAR